MKLLRFLPFLACIVFLSSCAELELASHLTKKINPPPKSVGTFKVGSPYKIKGKWYHPQESYSLVETGIASWYGPQFHGKQTANGETFDMNELTAAHKTLQMPSLVRVTNLGNGRSLIVRVNDRGPYKRGRIIDLSKRSAELLGFKNQGTAKVRIEVLNQESRQIAEVAKQGRSTKGYEVAMNQSGKIPQTQQPVRVADASYQKPTYQQSPSAWPQQQTAIEPASGGSASLKPVQTETLTAPTSTRLTNVTPGQVKNGNFYPDPIISERPVSPTNIYVQAGSFGVEGNAYGLSQKLSSMAQSNVYPAMVNGQKFYRVRLGPIGSVDEADRLLDRLIASGNNAAIIVVE